MNLWSDVHDSSIRDRGRGNRAPGDTTSVTLVLRSDEVRERGPPLMVPHDPSTSHHGWEVRSLAAVRLVEFRARSYGY